MILLRHEIGDTDNDNLYRHGKNLWHVIRNDKKSGILCEKFIAVDGLSVFLIAAIAVTQKKRWDV
jgi:hypothetical protein